MARELMTRDVERYERALRALHRRLLRDLAELEADALAPTDDQGDDGTRDEVEEIDLELIEHGDVTAHEVSLALKRIRSGTFGRCVDCGAAIGRRRLDALPYTRTCIDCQGA